MSPADPADRSPVTVEGSPAVSPSKLIATVPTHQGDCEVWATEQGGVISHNAPRQWGDDLVGALDYFTAGRQAVIALMSYREKGRWS